jgi:hypothetical protein
MSFPDIFKLVGWGVRYAPAILRLLRSPDGQFLIAGVKELSDGPADPDTTLHETLTKAGVDTKDLANRLAKEIHPEGQTPAQI